MLIEGPMQAHYVTFDDPTTLASAAHDPAAFLQQLKKPAVIDEVQMVPELFRVLKKYIDDRRRLNSKKANRQFLLTGSANIMALPQLADALVGRMAIHTLYPFSYGEIKQQPENFIKKLFAKEFSLSMKQASSINIGEVITKTTFLQLTSNTINATQWFQDYLTTLLQRDIRSLSEIDKLSIIPNVLKLLADRAGSLLNDSALARDVGLKLMTYRRYRTLLNNLFLTLIAPPWFQNIEKRLVKSPKIYFTDTYLLCYLLGVDPISLKNNNPKRFGNTLENVIASELTKQLSIVEDGSLYHYRTQDGEEIDFIIERQNKKLVAIEIKSRSSVTAEDFSTINKLQESVGKDFVRGIVLYNGQEILPFGKHCYAVPYQAVCL